MPTDTTPTIRGAAAGTVLLGCSTFKGQSPTSYEALPLKTITLKRTGEKLEIGGPNAATMIRVWYDKGWALEFTAYASADTTLPDPGDELVYGSLTFDVDEAEFQGDEKGPKLIKISASKKDGVSS